MIKTMYYLNTLDTGTALFAAILIGIAFGFFLERAGFSSSRKLSGVFYFKDMAVIKVMFTAVITAAIGLSCLISFGFISLDNIYLMPTVYGAHIVGGLIFGIGFAMGGWCPGTAAAGVACGKIDAIIFLLGTVIGSVIFNELFAFIKPLYQAGQSGVVLVYDSLKMSRNGFVLLLTLIAIIMFWLCEWLEKKRQLPIVSNNSVVLKIMSVLLLALSLGLNFTSSKTAAAQLSDTSSSEAQLLESIDKAQDHIEPEELAQRIIQGQDIIVVDVRPADEYNKFHIRNAMNIPLEALHQELDSFKNKSMIILYSNGMTHPAQARDSLYRSGFTNVYLLTDGLNGFIDRCLKPISLRNEPLSEDMDLKVDNWRSYFLASETMPKSATPQASTSQEPLVDANWLEKNLGKPSIKIIDLRSQPEYNTGHIPGSLALSVENLRTDINGIGSMLQPADMLARHMSLMGIASDDAVIFIYGDRVHDATLAGMALERLGHKNYAILNGGFAIWKASNKLLTTDLPTVIASKYQAANYTDEFTADSQTVLKYVQNKKAVIIDVRPADYYNGTKSDEARAGHVPGAINRPFSEDIVKTNDIQQFKSVEQLQTAYAQIIPTKETKVIVHCRTGHQASQTFFVLVRLLGYTNVLWYDAGWSEWAAKQELPIKK
ncbi:MAG: Rhodanese domain repeat protein [Candidatus Uhrbacteria bacterium GW2011_GWF2_41_16]|uniref:Rhodanese domain repeat protein n=1 Tax=Candidatus Uhrbacteria bacterium GW2011_GWF2_41_16 TaxID=1618997 RepID=A0A0G0V738_9BACT|nr:MAG: Rhodanese domain repeat protein [Candidatus Uhrbacteria bacterium GW2011_GWF2_41_16]